MFSFQNTPDFNCDESNMNLQSELFWSPEQNQSSTNYNVSPDHVKYNYFNYETQTVWSTQLENSALQHFQDGLTSHQFPVQYTPLTPEPVSYPALHQAKIQQTNPYMAKRHRAQISFVPTKTGNFKAIVKRKRKRTTFTTEQLQALENIFKRKQYITREDRQVISSQLQINDKAVKIWFQNRRLKDKKETEYTEEEHEGTTALEEMGSPDLARLDYVETQIINKTDEFGYVTLDDSLMKDLFNVIDDVLSHTSSNGPAEVISENDRSPIYEPISPASISDSNDDDACWQPSEPNESLQRLFDLQSMISL